MDKVRNAADKEQVEKASKQLKSEQELAIDDLKALLLLPQGKRFIWRQLENCQIFKLSYTGVAESTNFNEGQRNIGLKLLHDCLKAAPESFVDMMQQKGVSND